jgi:hypothetical protein
MTEGKRSVKDPLTAEEVNDFARRIYRHEIFTSWMAPQEMIGSIFMPLHFMSEEQMKEVIAEGGHSMWAEMSSAGPRSINGYPIFMTLNIWNEDNAKRIHKRVLEIVDMLDAPEGVPR